MCLLQKVRLNPKMVLGLAKVPEFFIIEILYIYLANRYLLWSLYLLSSVSFFKLHVYSLQRLENRHLVKPVLADEKTPTMKGTLFLEKNWIAPVFTTGFEQGQSEE